MPGHWKDRTDHHVQASWQPVQAASFDVVEGIRATLKKPPVGFEPFLGPGGHIATYNCRIFENRAGRIDSKSYFFLLFFFVLKAHAPVHRSQLSVRCAGIDTLSKKQFSSCCFDIAPTPVA